MKPYREKLGRFVEKHILPWKFELGVLVVALILGTFVVASYAHARPGYGPPDPEAWLERHEMEPGVKPCNIDLATGENCFGEKVIPDERNTVPTIVPDTAPCTLWRPVVMFSKPPKGWVPYKGGYTHPDCVPLDVHIPPLSPHNHLPCTEGRMADSLDGPEDLDCKPPRVRLEQQGDPRDILHRELRRMGYHVFQNAEGVWYTAKTDMYAGGKVVTCVGPIDSSETDCREWVAINDDDRVRACTIHGELDTRCVTRTVIYDYLMMQKWISGKDPESKKYSTKDWIILVLLAVAFGLLGSVIVDRIRGKGKANIGE